MTKDVYKPKNAVRVVTAASLFDGHDAAINIMRRIIQSSGAEVIHLGHDRSVAEIVDCAIQEDVQAIALTSYQGGHMEYFKYMHDLLQDKGAGHIKIFGGGGGVILPEEISELHEYGIAHIYSPDEGRELGLQGMINELLQQSDFPLGKDINVSTQQIFDGHYKAIAQMISAAENFPETIRNQLKELNAECRKKETPIVGITGTGGAGKSSLVDELIRRYLADFAEKSVAVLSVDPSKRRTGGALLGDRIRMNAIHNPRVYMRSLATRQANLSVSKYIKDALCIIKNAGFDLIILETSGIGQSDTQIIDYSDFSLYAMTPDYGAATQLEKIDMLDYADLIALNKFDKQGSQDALRDVRKQYARNHQLWHEPPESMPVYGTMASQFNDPGVDRLYKAFVDKLNEKYPGSFTSAFQLKAIDVQRTIIMPPNRVRYLSEIAETIRNYNQWAEEQAEKAQRLQALKTVLKEAGADESLKETITAKAAEAEKALSEESLEILQQWPERKKRYEQESFIFKVRGKEITIQTKEETLSHNKISKVALPQYRGWGDILKWNLKENVPGSFPFAAGVYPFKREQEDPTRMFAGEGSPERTNKRFHYIAYDQPAKRLSTAFDSVTLYGHDPDWRPDIYGKVGNSGVSVSCLDDAKKLYSGFDLANPKTSVSMTINGPAPTLMAYFLNTAIDQQCEKYIRENGMEDQVEQKLKTLYDDKGLRRPQYHAELPKGHSGLGLLLLGVTGDQILPQQDYEKIKADTIAVVRGTVQADILKEDQAQNTCIFSTEFSLKLMGDVQEYFINNRVRNFYSVSISGYHIAEAGANPITQLAYTLANGFTYVEYYASRGMAFDDFAPNFSFFFSNGVDAEYAVIGRVARLIWAKAMKIKYGANERSQKLKYHIQTSGRSLHAQEIAFNDIRTTLQALYAIYDNCNSLHTNAYDEAITTPTEESVRRALAIQMIINKELGLAKNQNPMQGSFIIEELTDLVEEAVLAEFDRITERGGVLGAMETMYQRGKIQEESMYYEALKNSGELPIVGVNTFHSSEGSPTVRPGEVIRATEEEKEQQIETVKNLNKTNKDISVKTIRRLKEAAVKHHNIFNALMEASKHASLGEITEAMFEVGGQYRRNM
jgi:methylmalonyl-CoA mutase